MSASQECSFKMLQLTNYSRIAQVDTRQPTREPTRILISWGLEPTMLHFVQLDDHAKVRCCLQRDIDSVHS